MWQAILESKERIIFKKVEKPIPRPNEVLIKIKKIGICGSDIHAFHGKHPYISFPIIQGHEFSGQITEVGKEAKRFQPGDNVTIMPQVVCNRCYPCTHGNYHICQNLKVIGCQTPGAAQEYFSVDENLVIKVPDNMSYDFGAMVEPLAVGVHALGKLSELKGINLLVLGAGPIGNLAAQAAKGLGVRTVMITDINEFRLEIAKKCGLDYPILISREDLSQAIEKHFGEAGVDATLECVGLQATIEQAIQIARKGTDIIVVGVFSEIPRVNIGFIQDKELRLMGTLMYREEDYHVAIELIQSGKIHLQPLISEYFSFMDYEKAYRFIENNKNKIMKVIINMDK
jgi:L-iditol 2-dehydrogenase